MNTQTHIQVQTLVPTGVIRIARRKTVTTGGMHLVEESNRFIREAKHHAQRGEVLSTIRNHATSSESCQVFAERAKHQFGRSVMNYGAAIRFLMAALDADPSPADREYLRTKLTAVQARQDAMQTLAANLITQTN